MRDRLAATIDLLGELVAFRSISQTSNLDIIQYVRGYLGQLGVQSTLSYDESRDRANLFATIGPAIDGGIILSGHTDVVPADDQDWETPPFQTAHRAGRIYGRGAVDMKGFIACVLAAVPDFLGAGLARPVHLALSFDEETGSMGARILADQMKNYRVRPSVAIVGEPTEMQIVSGHKGGFELTTTVTGLEGHASRPEKGVNAIFHAARMINHLEEIGRELARKAGQSPFAPPYSTISVGTIHGGAARNIIAGSCSFEWELRPVPEEDAEAVLEEIEEWVQRILIPEMRAVYPNADIVTILDAAYPGLRHDEASPAVTLLKELTGESGAGVVSFGSDAGHFDRIGISTVLCGPGSIAQAHKPNEFIAVDQLEACHDLLDRLREHLRTRAA